MELASCVQAVVNAATAYTSNTSDVNQVNLQRQLDVLIGLTSRLSALGFFSTKEMLPTECLSYLVDIMDSDGTNMSLAQKVMMLFDNLGNKKELRTELHATYHLTSSLAKFLKNQTKSAADPNTLLCLKLLHKITYGCKVSFQEAYLDDLMVFLIKQIQEKEDELTLPCIGLVANLCRNNFAVQMMVKNQEKVRRFYQKLASMLSHKNNRMVIFSLSALTSLCLNEDFGEKIFNARNIHQIFQLLFNVLLKGDVGMTRRYTVDVFMDLIKTSKIKHALPVVQEYLESCLPKVLTLLCQGQGDDIAKIFELLLSLCSVSGVRCVICRHLLETPGGAGEMAAYKAVIHWARQTTDTHCDAPLLALDFLKEMYEEILDQGVVATVTQHTDMVLTVAMEIVNQPELAEGSAGRKQAQKIIRTLQLLIVLAGDETLCPLVAGVISSEMCAGQLDHQLHNNPVGLKGIRWAPSGQPNDWSEDGVGILLYTLDLMIQLRKLVPNMEAQLCTTLQDPRLVSFLSQSVASGIRDQVHIVLKVISLGAGLPEFPMSILGDCLSAQISQSLSRARSADPSVTPTPGLTPSPLSNKENAPTYPTPTPRALKHRTMSDAELDSSVEGLVKKMQSGFELKDAQASEIISLYEHKIQSLQTKDSHLQDLLEAKALAMSQADRLITQYRCKMARTEAEAQKLRGLLGEGEKRCEDYREQINEMMLERERLSNDMEQVSQDNARLEAIADEHRDLSEEHSKQTKRLENTQRSLTTLRQEHDSLSEMHTMLQRHNESLKQEHTSMTEMHDMLRRHNDTLKQQLDTASQQLTEMDDERKSQSKVLKEKETKVQELTKSVARSDKDLRKLSRERDDLEATIDKLREELAKTETTKKELQHQVSSLELVCRKHEKALKDQESDIHDAKKEIEKHNKIAQLIHNITSGKES